MGAAIDEHAKGAPIASWRVLAAILPGVALAMSHSMMIDVPRADIIDALDTDKYRIHWITGSYLVGSAAGMCLTQFFAGLLGFRRAYLFGLMLFTLAGSACGLVDQIALMTPLRLAQGLGNGLLISVGMVTIWQACSARLGIAMAAYGVCTYVSTMLGLVAGGLITWFVSWQYLFFALLPAGTLAWIVAWWILEPHLGVAFQCPSERSDCFTDTHTDATAHPKATHRPRFDLFGFALWVIAVGTLNVMLDMGQYWGWITSRPFVLWCTAFVLSFAGFLAWGLLAKAPVINLRALRHRNATLALLVKMIFSINLTALFGLLTAYMVNLRGYQWWQAAVLILAPAATMMISVLFGHAISTPGNRKLRMFIGLAIMTIVTAQLMVLDFYSSKFWQAGMLAIWGLGAGLVIEPALVTIFEGLSLADAMSLAGGFNILRAVPAYVGLVTLATFWVQDTDAYFDLMRQTVQSNTPVVEQARQSTKTRFVKFGSPHWRAEQQSQALLHKWTKKNASAFALQIVFRDLAYLTLPALLLVLLIRRSSEKLANSKSRRS